MSTPDTRPPRRALWMRLALVAAFLVALFAIAEATGLRRELDLDMLRDTLTAHPIRGLALFVALFCLGNLAQIPGWLFLAAAVLALGRTGGGVVTYLAASTSCMVTFYCVRWLGGDALRQLEDEHGVQIHRWSDEDLAALEAAWDEVAAELVAEDADFARVYESYTTFRQNYRRWRDLAYLD